MQGRRHLATLLNGARGTMTIALLLPMGFSFVFNTLRYKVDALFATKRPNPPRFNDLRQGENGLPAYLVDSKGLTPGNYS